MSPEERQLLNGLFDRVRTASATPRDPEAEALIQQATRDQPYATYYLAQAVIVQEKGLEAAANRIKELEDHIRQLEAGEDDHRRAEQGGGFLSSIFGSSRAPAPVPASNAPQTGPWGNTQRQSYQQDPNYGRRDYDDGYRAPPPQQAPMSGAFGSGWGNQAGGQPSAGGSFLRGALGTAAGVAGGMLLANTLSSAFSSHTSALGLGSPFNETSNPFGTPQAPVEETVINNNYYGDDAIRQASGDDLPDPTPDDGLQQADFGNDSYDPSQDDFGSDDTGGDDNLNV
ncbi:DUF2076 domain-containing protein [Neorhizobium lilium]|uniref:DUF2076 domain-containing protein n=1 Tax=Neorhizobium lilium TaxID=2503024 RepID=A0A3S3SEY3_9HYPH|nr:DUF2076 domain-containing protein [Neorhizobium lilium]RWX78668.1 DUF2076 domain-containing protein [Neorhizobium lilium]